MRPKIANALALILILASFACLVPGLYLPALTLDISPTLPFLGKLTLYHQTRSILGTVRNLYETGNLLVAGLILLFSIAVPFAKGLILLYVMALKRAPFRMRLFRFVAAIGKWSMADVFVMGIFLAYLATGAANGVTARLHEGFWCFLGYCLLSVASAQLMRPDGSSVPDAASVPIV
ncbi:MAG TPA: paraquat-inducible protein A [Fibrobacteria bacterium]|nr:paraquat-inducible protein A [Fibrobacteria bacterium]